MQLHLIDILIVIIPLALGLVTTIWFIWGGTRDLRQLIRELKTVRRSTYDDGMVVGHRNLDELKDDQEQ